MDVYRLKHIPTGLYYTPSKGNGNLSKRGKLYAGRKPNKGYCTSIRIKIWSMKSQPSGHHKVIVDYFGLDWKNGSIDTYVKTREEDWEIEIVK
jgi:hypothetical protein